MTHSLTPRMRKALTDLQFECDYEDSQKGGENNFILLSALGSGIGDKTIADLLRLGLIEEGPNRWHDETGYRITAAGRTALR